jgi:PHP family Zn ribbon phosphoesterase
LRGVISSDVDAEPVAVGTTQRHRPAQVAKGILRVREGYFKITPGYDGIWGQLDIFEERETAELMQMRLF